MSNSGEKSQAGWWMVRNSGGKRDATLTFALIAFVIVSVKYLLSGASIEMFKGHTINFGSVDAASIAAFLGATLGAYIARRHSDVKYAPPSTEKKVDEVSGRSPKEG